MESDSGGDWRFAKYIPNEGYLGDDSFVMQVEGSGYTVKLRYFIAVTDDWGVTLNPNPICKGQIWKISQDTNGNHVLTSISSPVKTDTTLTSNFLLRDWLVLAQLEGKDADMSGVNVTPSPTCRVVPLGRP